jgi:hypothetical protein
VGQFFGNDNDELQPYISSAKQIPIPTYFVCGNEPQFTLLQDDNKEVCTNLKFLGRSGIRDIAGLRVAFLSGVYQPESFRNADQPPSFCHYTRSDVKLLLEAPRSGFENGVDIFLSSEWPRNFQSTLSYGLMVLTVPIDCLEICVVLLAGTRFLSKSPKCLSLLLDLLLSVNAPSN